MNDPDVFYKLGHIIFFLFFKCFDQKIFRKSEKEAPTIFIGRQRPLSFSVPLSFSFPLSVSLLFPTGVWASLPVKVHPALIVEAYPISLPLRGPYDCPAHLSEPQGSAVKHRVLSIVFETVVNDEAKVPLEGLKSEVAMGLQQVPHGLKVHRSVNMLQVIWNLQSKWK